LLAKFQV